MKKENIFLVSVLSVGAIVAVVGIILMSVCDLFIAGAVVMSVGLLLFVPVCPVYQKMGGYDGVFGKVKTTVIFIIGFILLAAFGVGIALGCSPIETVKDIQLGGFMLAGLSATLLGINAMIYDVMKS